MWKDYEASYNAALQDEAFLAWREMGARQKALNVAAVCRAIAVESVIEIGCGTGAVLRFLHSMHFAKSYNCLDLAPSAVQFVQESCRDFIQGAHVGSASALPFPDAAFDLAILSHVVEHLDDPIVAMREASRVARFVVVEVPTEKVVSSAIRTRILRRPYASIAGAGHVQFWSSSSIKTFLQRDCGLQILQHHCDLISREIEFYGKRGRALAKPIFKQALKAALPRAMYARLLTTHATFLCRRTENHYARTKAALS